MFRVEISTNPWPLRPRSAKNPPRPTTLHHGAERIHRLGGTSGNWAAWLRNRETPGGYQLGNWWFRNPHTKDFGKTWINPKNSFFVWWDCQGLVNLKMCKCLWTRQWVRCDFHDERKTSLRRWSRCNLADYETHSADSRSFSVFSTMQQYSSQWVLWPFSYVTSLMFFKRL